MSNIKINYMGIIKELIEKNAPSGEFRNIPASARVEYIEKYDNASLELIFSLNKDEFKEISDEAKKTKYLLQLYSKMRDVGYLQDTDVIKDDFYKMKIREQFGQQEYDGIVENFIVESNKYKDILETISNMSEEEKYKYISTIDSNDIKTLFFYKTGDISKRKIIVDSMEEDIDENIREQVKLAQKMILDFFQNNSNGQFTEKEKQELEMIFKRTKVELDDNLDYYTNGQMRHTDYTMKINPNLLIGEPHKMILYILHEYGHAISMKNFKTADYLISNILSVEEGMSDTFADLVAQSYADRNENVSINGQEIDFKNATILNYSAYRDHNNLVRTMLYPLEQSGTDKEAVFNYYFDNKLRFYELTLGKEYTMGLPNDFNKNPEILGIEYEVYEWGKEKFKTVNRDSIYAIKNTFLEAFIDDVSLDNVISQTQKTGSIKHADIKKTIRNGKIGLIELKKIQSIIANQINDKNRQEKSNNQDVEIIDYYEKYGITHNDNWQTIKKKLSIAAGMWESRSSTVDPNRPDRDEILGKIEEELNEIWNVRQIFDPNNTELLEEYNARLRGSVRINNQQISASKVNGDKQSTSIGKLENKDIER